MTPSREPARLTDGQRDIVIRGGRLIDPAAGRDEVDDLWIRDGRIVGHALDDAKTPFVIDASGKVVIPGLIDMRAHLREPGYEYKETILSGACAASAGGFTTVACLPDTMPAIDNAEVARFVFEQARGADARIYPIGAITRGRGGTQLTEIAEMVEAGIVAISEGDICIGHSDTMRHALEYAAMFDIPVITHCEDVTLSMDGVMNEGITSTKLGLKGIPNAAEDIMVSRDIALSRLTGGRLHIAHVSSYGSIALIRDAKRRGLNITADTAPHYFSLTEEAVYTYDTNTKVNPPLRTDRDIAALQEGLADGTIDAIATDHAPHASDEKTVEYDRAPFGITGLETAIGLVITQLVHPGILSLSDAIRKMTEAPARILGIDHGTLTAGSEADITVFDPNRTWKVDPAGFVSKSRNSPFGGWRLQGVVEYAIVGGRVLGWRTGQ